MGDNSKKIKILGVFSQKNTFLPRPHPCAALLGMPRAPRKARIPPKKKSFNFPLARQPSEQPPRFASANNQERKKKNLQGPGASSLVLANKI